MTYQSKTKILAGVCALTAITGSIFAADQPSHAIGTSFGYSLPTDPTTPMLAFPAMSLPSGVMSSSYTPPALIPNSPRAGTDTAPPVRGYDSAASQVSQTTTQSAPAYPQGGGQTARVSGEEATASGQGVHRAAYGHGSTATTVKDRHGKKVVVHPAYDDKTVKNVVITEGPVKAWSLTLSTGWDSKYFVAGRDQVFNASRNWSESSSVWNAKVNGTWNGFGYGVGYVQSVSKILPRYAKSDFSTNERDYYGEMGAWIYYTHDIFVDHLEASGGFIYTYLPNQNFWGVVS